MSVITLYHGSKEIIKRPKFGAGKPHNDYGLGFYCTKEIELAKEWACLTKTGGFANVYTLDISDLNVLYLGAPEYGILDWLAILVNNRMLTVDTPIMAESIEYLTKNFLPDTSEFDAIEGYRADDSYFAFAMDFVSNTISLRQLNRAMFLGELGEQFMLKSKKTFEAIKFVSSEPADGEIYFAKRNDRDKKARDEYLKRERKKARQRDDIFMLDILREEMKRNDARIQGNLS